MEERLREKQALSEVIRIALNRAQDHELLCQVGFAGPSDLTTVFSAPLKHMLRPQYTDFCTAEYKLQIKYPSAALER